MNETVGHNCSVPYPKDLPIEEIKNLIAAIRNPTAADKACAVHCGWVVLGYGLSQVLPHDCIPVMFHGAQEVGEYKVAAALEAAIQVKAGEDTAVKIPWEIILPILFDLVRQWWASRK